MPTYKLTYFDARGKAEISRFLFAAAGVEYEDDRIPVDKWPGRKPEMPLEAMPVLEIDGKKFCQGNAIARYIARTYGLFGSTTLDGLRIDELHEATEDVYRELQKLYYEKDDSKKKDVKTSIEDVLLPKYTKFFEKKLAENQSDSGFFIGSEMTMGDLVIYLWVEWIKCFIPDSAVDNSDTLQRHFQLVKSQPKIAEWLGKRPVTDM